MRGKWWLILTFAGCAPHPETSSDDPGDRPVELSFAARYGGRPLACGLAYGASGIGSTTVTLGDLRMFLSEVALVAEDGTEVPVALTDDRAWQGHGIALLDFADGTGACDDTADPATNTTIYGTVPPGSYDGVAFTVGVPIELGRREAPAAPVDLPAMQAPTGVDFLRMDLYDDRGAPDDLWVMRLLGRGCARRSTCAHPDRPRIRLSGFDPDVDTLGFDVATFLVGADLALDTGAGPPGCTSDDPVACPPLFANLGLDWTTGECLDGCAGQTAFGVE